MAPLCRFLLSVPAIGRGGRGNRRGIGGGLPADARGHGSAVFTLEHVGQWQKSQKRQGKEHSVYIGIGTIVVIVIVVLIVLALRR